MAHEEGSQLDQFLVGGVPTDREIAVQVRDALTWDQRVDASAIRVDVHPGGAVTLHGYVGTPEEKELAENITWRIRGVTEVVNNLKVAGPESCG